MKVYKLSIILLISITLVGLGGYFAWDYFNSSKKESATQKEKTIEEILEQSVDTMPVTTNFADGGFLKAQFKLITTSKKNAEELSKLLFKVESTIIKTINGIKMDEARGPEGFTLMEEKIKEALNKDFGSDYITRVYIVDTVSQ